MNSICIEQLAFKYKAILNRSSIPEAHMPTETICVELNNLFDLEKSVGVVSFNFRSELLIHTTRLRNILVGLSEKEMCIEGMTAILFSLAACMSSKDVLRIINRMYICMTRGISVKLFVSHGRLNKESVNH